METPLCAPAIVCRRPDRRRERAKKRGAANFRASFAFRQNDDDDDDLESNWIAAADERRENYYYFYFHFQASHY